MEKTLGIIKPNATGRNKIGRILTMIEDSELRVVEARMQKLTTEEAKGFYAEHKERPFFESLVTFMTSGRVLLLAIEGESAITKYRSVMGATNPAEAAPNTIRKIFGESVERNAVHGSDSPASADREIKYFFA